MVTRTYTDVRTLEIKVLDNCQLWRMGRIDAFVPHFERTLWGGQISRFRFYLCKLKPYLSHSSSSSALVAGEQIITCFSTKKNGLSWDTYDSTAIELFQTSEFGVTFLVPSPCGYYLIGHV